MNKILGSILVLGALAAAPLACGNGGAGGGSGGASSSASSGAGGAPGGGATCDSICTKSIALHCSAGVHVQSECVASCDMQQKGCSGEASTFQTYLDCLQSTPMVCGDATGSPSSADCVMQGLAILVCAGGGAGGSTSASTSSGGGCFALASFDSACASQGKPPHAYACTTAPPAGCVVGTSDGSNNGTYCCP